MYMKVINVMNFAKIIIDFSGILSIRNIRFYAIIKLWNVFFILGFRWFRVEGVGLRQVLPTSKVKYHLEVLILQELTIEDSGVYVCIVNNTVGSERVEVNLTVRSPLGASVEPATQVIDLNRQAIFTCTVVGWPVDSTSWYKNGYPLHVSHR